MLRPKSDAKIEANENLLHKKLDEVMKVELLGDKTADELKNIWLEYHKQKDVITATITSEIYDMQMKRGREYPLFIVPLPRSQGFEFFLLQFSVNSIHFTPLLCYQVGLKQIIHLIIQKFVYYLFDNKTYFYFTFRYIRKMLRNV